MLLVGGGGGGCMSGGSSPWPIKMIILICIYIKKIRSILIVLIKYDGNERMLTLSVRGPFLYVIL